MTVHPSARNLVRQMLPKVQPRRPKPNRDGFPAAVKAIVEARSGGICERDGCGPAEVIHHRRPRGAGGTSLPWVNQAANGFHVSNACHDWIEGRDPAWSRIASADVGWLVSQHSGRTASEVPVLYRGRWVNLTDDGEVHPIGGAA
ncbi:hypothetical protein [Nocardia spumae]|uniref:hypothetical protein n=1 Tax=Nocardia spumae TaxID=2887190 RepID=UPI001D156B0D|nr:hypothetical protein [Nocardia spumae]